MSSQDSQEKKENPWEDEVVPPKSRNDSEYYASWHLEPSDSRYKMAVILKDLLLTLINDEKLQEVKKEKKLIAYSPYADLSYPSEIHAKIWNALEAHLFQPDIHQLKLSQQLLISFFWQEIQSAHKVGGSLYLLHEIHDRGLVEEPGLGKAYWLLASSPLNDGTFRKQPKDALSYERFWAAHYEHAEEWAAFVALTNSPLDLRDDAFHTFLNQNPEKFKQLVWHFREFRQKYQPPRMKAEDAAKTYIKRGSRLFLEGENSSVAPNEKFQIPDLLLDFQWAKLKDYSSERDSRRRRKKTVGST